MTGPVRRWGGAVVVGALACQRGEAVLVPEATGGIVPSGDTSTSVPYEGPPNVLIVLLDDLGIDKVAAYHPDVPDLPPQPTLDRLSAEGLRFTTAWAQPMCSPTRAALLTGRHARRLGIGDWLRVAVDDDELAPGVPLLPALLDRLEPAPATAAFGKWHLSTEASPSGVAHPNLRGFDHYAGSPGNVGIDYSYMRYPMVVDGQASIREGYLTTDTVDDALAWIEATPPPWFAYVATHAVHVPFHTPPASLHGQGSPTTEAAQFVAMVEALDTELGRLIDGVPAAQRDHTYVVVVGDNGTSHLAVTDPFPEWSVKGTPTDGGMRVPMWILGPDVPAGRTTDALVHVVDILPTVAGWMGLPLDTPTDGVDLAPVLVDPDDAEAHDILYADRFGPAGAGPYLIDWRAVRDRTHKLAVDERTGFEFLARVGEDLRDEVPLAPGDWTEADRAAEARLRVELDRLREELVIEVDLP